MTNSKSSNAVTVTMLGKEYLIACTEEEETDLRHTASFVDRKMREIRDSGNIIGTDRIAVMAALNIAHELLNQDNRDSENDPALSKRILGLQHKIEEALYKSRQLEL